MADLTNLDRSMLWLKPKQPGQSFGTGNGLVGCDGNVYTKTGYVWQSTTLTSSGARGIGVLFRAPEIESVPYRIKSGVTAAESTGGGNAISAAAFGWAYVDTPAIGDNTIRDGQYFGSYGSAMDDVWCIAPETPSVTTAVLCFFLIIDNASDAKITAHLHVQQLNSKPDNYARGIV